MLELAATGLRRMLGSATRSLADLCIYFRSGSSGKAAAKGKPQCVLRWYFVTAAVVLASWAVYSFLMFCVSVVKFGASY